MLQHRSEGHRRAMVVVWSVAASAHADSCPRLFCGSFQRKMCNEVRRNSVGTQDFVGLAEPKNRGCEGRGE